MAEFEKGFSSGWMLVSQYTLLPSAQVLYGWKYKRNLHNLGTATYIQLLLIKFLHVFND